MNRYIKSTFVLALGLSSLSALAGEIASSAIYADEAKNTAGANHAIAYQNIGVTEGSGRILNSRIYGQNARNDAFSRFGVAAQSIGAVNNGTMDNVTVNAFGAFNRGAGLRAFATQSIGVIEDGGTIRNSLINAPGALNNADRDDSEARQRIGVVR
jgi:hypothetical protein